MTRTDSAFAAVRAAEKLSTELSSAMFATSVLSPRRDELREQLRLARIAEVEAREAFRRAIADARAGTLD